MDDRERSHLRAALASIFDEDMTGRFTATPDWQIVDCNLALAQLFGAADQSALVGQRLTDLAFDPVVLEKLLSVARAEGRAGPAEVRFRTVDGDPFDVSLKLTVTGRQAQATSANEGLTVGGQLLEITESKRLQMRLAGAERMELIGRLAGGLAHDFNNLLMVITGNTERLLGGLPDEGALRTAAIAIQEASSRASSLTRQLLAFSRRQVFELHPVSLARLVTHTRSSIEQLLGDRIQLDISTAPDVPEVNADARQVEQVIRNLANNAREAITGAGAVTIRVDTLDVQAEAAKARVWLRPGKYVRLVVSDTGRGMDATTRAYAFQPFFTTKPIGDGRGLGLAMVYGIMKQSHGFVWVDSEPGAGATFTLLFPLTPPASDTELPAAGPAATETVLVTEPDARLRGLVGDALRRRGYQVLEAASGAEAVGVFAGYPARVHLLISNAGAEASDREPLASRLRAIDPLLQSLVMLAPVDADTPPPAVLPTTPSIQKPFSLRALSERVREVLDSGEGRG